jgi:acyl transferase domain-containing protein/SAM-dependent methyltransferase
MLQGSASLNGFPEKANLKQEITPDDHGSMESLNYGKLLLITANTSESLQAQIRNLRDYGLTNPAIIDDICYTMACRREHLSHRAFAVVQGTSIDSKDGISLTGASPLRLAMIFTGQGAQWPRMGVELLHSDAAFASSIRAMDLELRGLPSPPSWSIEDELKKSADSSTLDQAALSQPLCTAIQVALVDTLAELAIRPNSVLGHSSGEIAAAYAAGRISRRAAIVIAYYRGVTSQGITRDGAMAVIGLSWDEVATHLKQNAVLACNNSPSNVTISGNTAAVRETVETIQNHKPDAFVRILKVNIAYHSHHMLDIGPEYEREMEHFLDDDNMKNGTCPDAEFFSSVTRGLLPASEGVDAGYFRRNLESPVMFSQAVDGLLGRHKESAHHNLFFLEIGPHSALSGPLRQILTHNSANYSYASCLQRDTNSNRTFLAALGTLWQHGGDFDLNRLTNPSNVAKVLTDIPLYPWQHDGLRFPPNRIVQAWRYPNFSHHELLGSLILENTKDQPSFRNILQLEQVSWLRDHNIQGDVILPCSAYLAMAGEASRRLHASDENSEFVGFSVKNMVIGTAMILEESKAVEVVTSLRKWRITDNLESNGWEFTISSYSGTTWTKHCSGSVEGVTSLPPSPAVLETHHPRKTNTAKWYQAMWHFGARYGPYFQGLKDIESSPNEKITKAVACDNTPRDCESNYLIHPTTMDHFLQTIAVAASNGQGHAIKEMIVPTFIEQIDVYNCEGDLQVYTSAKLFAHGRFHGSGHAIGTDGALAIRMRTAKVTPLDTAVETDPHAGAMMTWNLEPSFTSMSTLVQRSTKAAKTVPVMQEYMLLHIQAALNRIQGMVPASDTTKRFVAWMKRQPIPDVQRSIESVSPEARSGSNASAASAIEKIAENIVGLVANEISPLELFMADFTQIYRDLKATDREPYFKLLGHLKPNMRILEIVAGTGGTTQEILPSLINPSDGGKLWSSYTYTDISAGFFGAAKEAFKDYPALEFKTLDITKHPVSQGFDRHSYDLIIANNVIHAVPNLQEALRNVHTLLRPDGTFYLEELCCDVKYINFIMGLLPGWWLGEEDERSDEPYVQPDRWDRELRAAGFSGLDDCMLDAPRPYQL